MHQHPPEAAVQPRSTALWCRLPTSRWCCGASAVSGVARLSFSFRSVIPRNKPKLKSRGNRFPGSSELVCDTPRQRQFSQTRSPVRYCLRVSVSQTPSALALALAGLWTLARVSYATGCVTRPRNPIVEMALVKCPECGKKVSTGADFCPNCGCKKIPKTAPGPIWPYLVVSAGLIWLLAKAYTRSGPEEADTGIRYAPEVPPEIPVPAGTVVPAVPLVLEVSSIAGQSKTAVVKILGKPVSCAANKYGQKCVFKTAGTEIVFINGKADWITVGGLDGVPYNESALSALGLKPSRPTVANFNVLRWTNVPGFVEIAVFPSTAGIDYAYIKTTTP